MKYLGIDYGAKHIGLAVSDRGGSIAMPKQIIENNENGYQEIVEMVATEQVESIVIGESKDFEGNPNQIQSAIEEFSQWLVAQTGLPINATTELFSSKMAKQGTEHMIRFNPRNIDRRKLHKRERRIDDKAATIMLQSFLDAQV